MKRFIAIVGIVCVAASALADSKPVEKGGFICRTKQQDAELGDWISGLINKNHESQASAAKAIASQKVVEGNLELAKGDGIKLAQERDKAILDLAHVLKKLHFLKFAISALVTLLAIFVILKLGIPPPLSIYIMLGAIAAGNALLWFLL